MNREMLIDAIAIILTKECAKTRHDCYGLAEQIVVICERALKERKPADSSVADYPQARRK